MPKFQNHFNQHDMSILLQHSELVHMGPKSQFTWGRSMQSQPLREWKLGLRVVLHYGGEVHRSWILREFWNFIGWKWHSCLVVVCTMAKSPLVESFVHGWKKWHGCQRGDIFSKGGVFGSQVSWATSKPQTRNLDSGAGSGKSLRLVY